MKRTIILNSGKCSWGRCIFCGWGKHDFKISTEALINAFNARIDESVTSVKVFGSGSFLDEKQFPLEFMKHAAKVMQGRELVVESRPEYVTKDKLDLFKGVKLTVAMGLEAADDAVLRKLRKGVTLNRFIKACELIHKQGFRVKAYILVNPPFDYPGLLAKSVKFGLKHCDELVLINTYPHAKAELFEMWIKGEWKPINEAEFNKRAGKYKSTNVSLDFDNYSFIPRFPEQIRLVGVGTKYLKHPYFEVWQDYFVRFYKRPVDKDIAFLLPCSKRKPYHKSRTHKFIRRSITGFPFYKRLHLVVISNPGVVPSEFSDKYPFTSYDWDERKETPAIKREYIKVTTERIKAYLKAHQYKHCLCYFKPDSESYQSLSKACKSLKIKLISLVDDAVYNQVKGQRNPLIQRELLNAMRERLKQFQA